MLSEGDAEGLWEKLHWSVSHHNAIKSFVAAQGLSAELMRDRYLDLTQDLFVRLLEKNRWEFYLDANYTTETIEHELNHLEIPNLISVQLRKRHPEAFRIARRVSNILKTSSEFKYYGGAGGRSQASGRLVSRIYGLSSWSPSVLMKEESTLPDLIRGVDFRMRETRRSGRGRSSQIIISNKALRQLLIDIFDATQSLMEVRTVRLLALSKVAVEDSRFVSVDEQVAPAPGSTQFESYRIDLADKRPSPEEELISSETDRELDYFAEDVISSLKRVVRNKPRRFSKLVRVVWYCYFDPVSRSQGEIAGLMGVSDSLVCHYRKLFDAYVQHIPLPFEQWIALNRSIETRLAAIMSGIATDGRNEARKQSWEADAQTDLPKAYIARAAVRG